MYDLLCEQSEDEGPVITGDRLASQAASLSDDAAHGGGVSAPLPKARGGRRLQNASEPAASKAAAAGSRKRKGSAVAGADAPPPSAAVAAPVKPTAPARGRRGAGAAAASAPGSVGVEPKGTASRKLEEEDLQRPQPKELEGDAKRRRHSSQAASLRADEEEENGPPARPVAGAEVLGDGGSRLSKLPPPPMSIPAAAAATRHSQHPSLAATPLARDSSPMPPHSTGAAPKPAASNLSKPVSELQQHFEEIDQEQLQEEDGGEEQEPGGSRGHAQQARCMALTQVLFGSSGQPPNAYGRMAPTQLVIWPPEPVSSAKAQRGPSRFKSLTPARKAASGEPSPLQAPDLDPAIDLYMDLRAEEEGQELEHYAAPVPAPPPQGLAAAASAGLDPDQVDQLMLALATFSDSQVDVDLQGYAQQRQLQEAVPAPGVVDSAYRMPGPGAAAKDPKSLLLRPSASLPDALVPEAGHGPLQQQQQPLCLVASHHEYGYGDEGSDGPEEEGIRAARRALDFSALKTLDPPRPQTEGERPPGARRQSNAMEPVPQPAGAAAAAAALPPKVQKRLSGPPPLPTLPALHAVSHGKAPPPPLLSLSLLRPAASIKEGAPVRAGGAEARPAAASLARPFREEPLLSKQPVRSKQGISVAGSAGAAGAAASAPPQLSLCLPRLPTILAAAAGVAAAKGPADDLSSSSPEERPGGGGGRARCQDEVMKQALAVLMAGPAGFEDGDNDE